MSRFYALQVPILALVHFIDLNDSRGEDGLMHKAYLEYRTVSGVFRTIDPPPPLPLASVSSPPPTKGGGGCTHSPGVEGVGGQYFGRRQTLDWPLTI
jgi:hypothetical protein